VKRDVDFFRHSDELRPTAIAAPTLRSFRRTVAGQRREVLVIDDGSALKNELSCTPSLDRALDDSPTDRRAVRHFAPLRACGWAFGAHSGGATFDPSAQPPTISWSAPETG